MSEHAGPPDADMAAPLDARMEGALIAARGIAHLLNNDLAGALGNLSVALATAPDLPPEARERLERTAGYIRTASLHLQEFQRIQRLVTRDSAGGPVLDLGPSLEPDGP